VPASGQNRITGMIEAKPDWVVSRQRAWGVPITVFVKKGTNDILLDPEVNHRIGQAFETEGADAWFADPTGARFLTPPTKLAPKGYNPADYEKVTDVLDVWFDSGSTHTYVLNKAEFPGLQGIHRKVDGGRDTVMYLEGSDQHRGWFHSSLIESSGTRGRAPFDVVLTHGFILDEKGDEKMSKSKGNVLSPQDVMKNSGADILRLWVASADTTSDIRFGPAIVQAASDSYRKMRNTLRWMLGALAHFGPEDRVSTGKMPELERLMLHRLAELDPQIRSAYAKYEYAKVVSLLQQFMNTELSAFYFDIRKDTLYCEPPSSLKRRAALTVVDHICDALLKWLAPILVFTADEAWQQYRPTGAASVHLLDFPDIPANWLDAKLDAKWEQVRRVRSVVTGALEIERANKRIGSSLEAAPEVFVTGPELVKALEGIDLAEIAITSAATLKSDTPPVGAFTDPDVPGVAVVSHLATGKKCARSWRITTDVGSDPAYPDLSARDAAAVREIDALKSEPT
jgi:isoleucyl-tRNA synthetase